MIVLCFSRGGPVAQVGGDLGQGDGREGWRNGSGTHGRGTQKEGCFSRHTSQRYVRLGLGKKKVVCFL